MASRHARVLAAVMAGAVLAWMPRAEAAGDTLNAAIFSADAGPLDPHIASGTPEMVVVNWLFNGLVRFRPGETSLDALEPDLAESWEASPDGRTWTFRLRRGVQCHEGYGELTAEDVAYSLARAADPKRSSFSGAYKDIKVETPDRYTVRISLAAPVPSLLGLVANDRGGLVVCKKAAEALGDDFKKHPIGTGPFAFADYQPKQSLTLAANKDYFRGAPKLARIVYRYIPSDASRTLALTSGELDLIWGVRDEKWISRTRESKGVAVDIVEPAELFTVHLNTTKPPLDDLRVRRAVASAVDRRSLVQFKGPSSTRAATSIVPIGYLGQSAEAPLPPYDVAKAKALLAEAGHPNGVALKAIQTTSPNMLSTMQVVQAMLRKAGIDLELETVEHATFHAQIRKDLSQVVGYAAARFPVADIYLTEFYHSRSTVSTPTAVANFSHCAVADAEIDQARAEPDPERKLQLWAAAQKKISEAVCSVPLIESLGVWARRDTLDYGYAYKGSMSGGPVVNELTHFK